MQGLAGCRVSQEEMMVAKPCNHVFFLPTLQPCSVIPCTGSTSRGSSCATHPFLEWGNQSLRPSSDHRMDITDTLPGHQHRRFGRHMLRTCELWPRFDCGDVDQAKALLEITWNSGHVPPIARHCPRPDISHA